MIVYKVVRIEDEKMYSSFVTGKARVEYILKKEITAPKWLAKKGYHLFVFENYQAASKVDFLRAVKILRCRIRQKDIIKKPPELKNTYNLSRGRLKPTAYDELSEMMENHLMVKSLTPIKIL